MSQLVYEGTWEDVARHASELKGRRVRLTVENNETPLLVIGAGSNTGHLYFGMFKGEPEVAEEEFKLAEWRGEDVDI